MNLGRCLLPRYTHSELIRSAVEVLEGSQVPRPQWTAEQLLAHRAGCLPLELYVEEPALDDEALARFHSDVAARAGGVPLQYLMGVAGFYGRDFFVGPGVFSPRPETEVLVETALAHLGSQAVRPEQAVHPSTQLRMNGASKDGRAPRVVDVGTGSGAIAVTLALERPGLRVTGVERSEIALSFTRRNALHHGAEVRLVRGDLAEPLAGRSVDLLVANLPYLDPEGAHRWPRELHWEPWVALDGGAWGADLIRKLLSSAGRVLAPTGRVILEIGPGQVDPVCAFAEERGMHVVDVVQDLAAVDRVVVLQV